VVFWAIFLIELRPFLSLLCVPINWLSSVERMHIRCHRGLPKAIETKQIPNRRPLVRIRRCFCTTPRAKVRRRTVASNLHR
jgi:hypothetical protein